MIQQLKTFAYKLTKTDICIDSSKLFKCAKSDSFTTQTSYLFHSFYDTMNGFYLVEKQRSLTH